MGGRTTEMAQPTLQLCRSASGTRSSARVAERGFLQVDGGKAPTIGHGGIPQLTLPDLDQLS